VNISLVQDVFYAACVTTRLVKIHITKGLQDYYGHPQIRHILGLDLVQTVSKPLNNSTG